MPRPLVNLKSIVDLLIYAFIAMCFFLDWNARLLPKCTNMEIFVYHLSNTHEGHFECKGLELSVKDNCR